MSELKKIATRQAYGEALREFGADPRIVALDADLGVSTMSAIFGQAYPERYFDMGIAEANMAGVAAGLSTTGKIVFIHSFAMFAPGRMYDQVRNSIAFPRLNVKVIGSHAGVTVGQDGPTHQALEDIALMRALPGMVVLSPCDANETRLALQAILEYEGPCFMRTGRLPVEQITQDIPGYRFELGKGCTLRDGKDVTIVATGFMVAQALQAADALARDGVSARVIDIHTIKPLDEALILAAARETGAIVTAEEHNIIGGLGGAVAELLVEHHPIPMERVGVRDTFGKSGDPAALVERFGLTPGDIAKAAQKAIARK